MSKHDLKNRVLKNIDGIESYPEKSKNRLTATVEGRLEWCLSRQRVWGVPIPALLCMCGEYVYTNQQFIQEVAEHVKKEGIEYWDKVSVDQIKPNNLQCPDCSGTVFIKEQDILDVWFDSGISHFAVLRENNEQKFPADIYLEGKDQHRGWFQSSLLTAQVLEEEAPMKQILTHGFTVDEYGKKMSKSLGNVVSPEQMIKELGTDGLRLWASSIDYADDAVVSPVLLANVKEVMRKIRNTCRFLLSNLYDYDHKKDAVALHDLLAIDFYALEELNSINEKVMTLYDEYDLTAVFHALAQYCSVQLSSFYLDIIKDRLYVEKSDGPLRRSAQTVCWYILDALTKMMAPILSFTAEQISDLYQKNKQESIHLQLFAELISPLLLKIQMSEKPSAIPMSIRGIIDRAGTRKTLETVEYRTLVEGFERQWSLLKDIRNTVLKAIEQLREKGIIKHSLESKVFIYFDSKTETYQTIDTFIKSLSFQSVIDFFKEFFIVSQVSIANDNTALQKTNVQGFYVHVEVAQGNKCPRCWQWSTAEHIHNLCDRCFKIIE